MIQVFLNRLGEDEDVVQVDKDECVQLPHKHLIHQTLEGRRRVRNPKRHHNEFEMASMHPERGFWDVIFFHGYLMIARGQVDGGKVFSFSKSVQEVINARQRIAVLDRLFVQSPIVDAHAPSTVLLQNKEDRGAVRALRCWDVSLRQ